MRHFSFIIFFLGTVFFNLSFAQTGLDHAEDFLVKDVNGQMHQLNSYLEEGKIVVLPFFTTTCGSCNIYSPEIAESYFDFGCNQGDVFYLGLNWGDNNIGVIDFMSVHAVEYPCVSGLDGQANLVNEQYEIASHITTLVLLPDGSIAGQFYGPNAWPTRDSLNNLLLHLGAEMQTCNVGINNKGNRHLSNIIPNPAKDYISLETSHLSAGNYQFCIFNMQGQKVFEENIYISTSESISFSIAHLTAAHYLARLTHKNQVVINQSFVKE